MNKDQVEGRVEETKSKVKEVIDDKGLEVEGNVQKNLGKAQKGYGDIKQDIKEGK
ncbi:general stress protein CsbD [Methylomonas methanica]|uniref:General stress protein CsbD n=1 Tax=Methylomonas denitrificans TaxID=1538553 RepID=A0A126T8Z6_9GAMM|nr:general stress protein CsbD [Methylomonas denitrificans]OAH98909.1 general stress protein CsbD [Methylomonas methanica]